MDVSSIEKKIFRQLISNPSVLAKYIGKISSEDFTTPIIRNVVAAFEGNASALAHYVPSKAFFEILMRDRVHLASDLDQLASVLVGLASDPSDIKDLDMLVRELKSNRMCREMTKIIQRSLPSIRPDTIDDAYTTILRDLLQLPLNACSVNVSKLREVHDALEERVLEYSKPALAKISTGIRAFDAGIGGFTPGDLVLISAGVSHGKSNILLWWAEQMVEAGRNTLYVTIEMSYEQTMDRYNAIHTGFDTLDISNKRIPQSQIHIYYEKLIAANKEKSAREAFLRECATIADRSNPHGALALSKKYKNRPAKMFIMDLPGGCTPVRVEQEIQRLSMDNKIDCVFVDFINVMDPTFHNKDRARELANISRELKIAARKLDVVMFTAAQLDTTQMEGTQDEIITTDNIKYAKAIGENANWVMAFFRTAEDNLKKQVRFQIAKARGGLAVTALLEFDFATLQVIDLGFADGSAIPYGYLKNGMRTAEFAQQQQENNSPVQQTLGGLGADEPLSSPPAAPTGFTPTALPPLPPMGTDERDVEMRKRVEDLRTKFQVESIKTVESDTIDEGWI